MDGSVSILKERKIVIKWSEGLFIDFVVIYLGARLMCAVELAFEEVAEVVEILSTLFSLLLLMTPLSCCWSWQALPFGLPRGGEVVSISSRLLL